MDKTDASLTKFMPKATWLKQWVCVGLCPIKTQCLKSNLLCSNSCSLNQNHAQELTVLLEYNYEVCQ